MKREQMDTSQASQSTSVGLADPIDVLVPPPWPRWARFMVAILLIIGVSASGYLWQRGYLRPSPYCCGTAESSPAMSLTSDGQAVVVSVLFFNGSAVDLRISDARADLPGTQVISVTAVDHTPGVGFSPLDTIEFPVVVPAQAPRWIGVTFVPDTCDDITGDWGTVTLHLSVTDSWLPTIDRTLVLPSPVVKANSGGLRVLPLANGGPLNGNTRPLPSACAILKR